MAGFGVRLLEFINNLIPPPKHLQALDAAKSNIGAYQAWERDEIERISADFGPLWNLKGQDICDIGCGLGGKTPYYAKLGGRSVTAIDLRFESLLAANQFNMDQVNPQIHFIQADAAHIPFNENSFDVIVSVNVFEHVDNPIDSLKECHRVLRRGGLIFLHFPPYYSPWGAHLEGWINIPWLHLLFSDKLLIETARNIENANNYNAKYIQSAQVDWANLNRLPELNRLTVRQFLQLIKNEGLIIVEAKMLPLGRHYFPHRGRVGKWVLKLLSYLVTLPGLREVITTKMVYISKKAF